MTVTSPTRTFATSTGRPASTRLRWPSSCSVRASRSPSYSATCRPGRFWECSTRWLAAGSSRSRPPSPPPCWPRSASPALSSTSSSPTPTRQPSASSSCCSSCLALARGRPLLAGLAAGGAALTRPEFAIVAAVTLLAAALGRWREAGWRAGLREALVLCLPALIVAGGVLGGFALAVGADRLFFENLIPLDFTRVAGFRFQQNWAPFTIESFVATLARGALWIVPVLALGISLEGVRARRGVRRVLALWPLVATALVFVAIDALSRLLGAFPGTRSVVEDEVVRLLIPMSWLPVAALAAGVWALVALCRNNSAPLGVSWPADLAVIAAGLALAVRAYNEFTTDIYATYYAAVPLLLAAIGLDRLAARRPTRPAGPAGRPGHRGGRSGGARLRRPVPRQQLRGHHRAWELPGQRRRRSGSAEHARPGEGANDLERPFARASRRSGHPLHDRSPPCALRDHLPPRHARLERGRA